tara:strand:- start:2580 stop:2987 length:408 start_codon:yes stop_codon:yes gene_type:complete
VTAEVLMDKISIHKGKSAVLVNIWALWCVPCIEEFPMIVNLHKKNNDLEVIFVNADFEDEFQDVLRFLNTHNIGPISYIKSQKDDPFIKGINPDWTGSLPFTLVFGKESGILVDFWEGREPSSRFRNAIDNAINL